MWRVGVAMFQWCCSDIVCSLGFGWISGHNLFFSMVPRVLDILEF